MMKKSFALLISLILALGLAACSPMDNVPTLEEVKGYSTDDFNKHFRGVNRDDLIEVWGEPIGSLQEYNADMWNIDDESLVMIYWKNNGVFKGAGICVKDELPSESESSKTEFSIFAHADIVSAIKNDIPEVSDSWTDADNPFVNYERIVSLYTPENFSQNDSTYTDCGGGTMVPFTPKQTNRVA